MGRVIEGVVESATLLAADSAIHHERGGGGEIPKFQKIRSDFEVPVEFLNLGLEIA